MTNQVIMIGHVQSFSYLFSSTIAPVKLTKVSHPNRASRGRHIERNRGVLFFVRSLFQKMRTYVAVVY